MNSITLNIIRKFSCRKDNNCFDALLKIDRLDFINESQWACVWSMDYLFERGGHVYGMDPLDAIINCLRMAESLMRSASQDGVEIWWLDEGDKGQISWVPLE